MTRSIYLFFVLILVLLSSTDLRAQTETTYFQHWQQLPEDAVRHTEVFVAVADCSGTPEIHLNIFNEVGEPKLVSIVLTVTDPAKGTQFIHKVTDRAMRPGEMAIGGCATEDPDTRITLPDTFDPRTAQVSVTYPK
jgi:hypothetical protein